MKFTYRFISALLAFFSLTCLAYPEEMYLCIWRNPERTMARIFPEARDYKTISRKIGPDNLKKMEERAGKLLPGQRELFQYFELTGPDNALLGYIFAGSHKGEYGAIELVVGINAEGRIKGVYVQRTREKEKEFKRKEFLDQFIGMSLENIEAAEPGRDTKFKRTAGTRAVLSIIKKELTAFNVLAGPR